jgi:hypothetical protein
MDLWAREMGMSNGLYIGVVLLVPLLVYLIFVYLLVRKYGAMTDYEF